MESMILRFEPSVARKERDEIRARQAMGAKLRWLAGLIESGMLANPPTGVFVAMESEARHELQIECVGGLTRDRIRAAARALATYAEEAPAKRKES